MKCGGFNVFIQSLIVASKERCQARGLIPNQTPQPGFVLNNEQLLKEKRKYYEALAVFSLFAEKVLLLLAGTPHLIVVTNDEGYLLDTFGDQTIKDMMNRLGIKEGIRMDEDYMGTNTVFLSLHHNAPIEIVGPGHYHQMLEHTACYSVPFHFKEINLVGTTTIMTSIVNHNHTYLALLANMVDSVEREISLRRINKNQTLIHHLMVNNVRNGVVMTDPEGNITEFNASVEKIIGRNRDHVIGTSVFPFEHIGEYINEVLKSGQRFENVEVAFRSSLNRQTICLFDAFPIYNDRYELLGAFAQLLDITERVELEKQIIISEKFSAIGRLAAGLAHEIRNPLTSVMGFIQLMHHNKNPQKFEEYFDLLETELQNVKSLVSDFVVMAKPSTPERRLCDIQELVRETIRFMESQAILKNTTIKAEYAAYSILASVDSAQIKQVLMNLIQNAIEAITNNGDIHIRTAFIKEKDFVSITIEDNGIGIEEEDLGQILNPFFSTKENGLGLGLSVCYRIIENHRGKMLATSQKGLGTRFEILLPAN
jgi:two-component system, sporulation sensor kinase E